MRYGSPPKRITGTESFPTPSPAVLHRGSISSASPLAPEQRRSFTPPVSKRVSSSSAGTSRRLRRKASTPPPSVRAGSSWYPAAPSHCGSTPRGVPSLPPPLGAPLRSSASRAGGSSVVSVRSVSVLQPDATAYTSCLNLERVPGQVHSGRQCMRHAKHHHTTDWLDCPPSHGASWRRGLWRLGSPPPVLLASARRRSVSQPQPIGIPWRTPPCLASPDAEGKYDSTADQGSPVARSRSVSPVCSYSPSRGVPQRSLTAPPTPVLQAGAALRQTPSAASLSPAVSSRAFHPLPSSGGLRGTGPWATPRSGQGPSAAPRGRPPVGGADSLPGDWPTSPSQEDAEHAVGRLRELCASLLCDPPLGRNEVIRILGGMHGLLDRYRTVLHHQRQEGSAALLQELVRGLARHLSGRHAAVIQQAAAVVRKLAAALGSSLAEQAAVWLVPPLIGLAGSSIARFRDTGHRALRHLAAACSPLQALRQLVAAAETAGTRRVQRQLLVVINVLLLSAARQLLPTAELTVGESQAIAAVPHGTTAEGLAHMLVYYADIIGTETGSQCHCAHELRPPQPRAAALCGVASLEEGVDHVRQYTHRLLRIICDALEDSCAGSHPGAAAAACFWPCHLFDPERAAAQYAGLPPGAQAQLHLQLPSSPLIVPTEALAPPQYPDAVPAPRRGPDVRRWTAPASPLHPPGSPGAIALDTPQTVPCQPERSGRSSALSDDSAMSETRR